MISTIIRATTAMSTTTTTITTPTITPVLDPLPAGDGTDPAVGAPAAHVSRVAMVTHVPHKLSSLGPRHPAFIGHDGSHVALPEMRDNNNNNNNNNNNSNNNNSNIGT